MRPLVVVAFTLLSVGSAWAQTASVPRAKTDIARASWRKLSQNEVDCVDRALLRLRGSQIWHLIERGIGSDDASVARVRAGCRKEIKALSSRTAVANATRASASPETTSALARTPKPPVEPATSVMAAAERKNVGKTGVEDTAEFDVEAEKPSAEHAAPGSAAALTIVTTAVSAGKPAANQAVAEKASAGAAVEIARAEATSAKARADQARYEAQRATADAIASIASANWGMGFMHGLVSGPAVLAIGGIVFWLMRRRRRALAATRSEPDEAPDLLNSPAGA